MDLRAETLGRWRSNQACRQKHSNGCPHSKQHWRLPARTGRADIQGLRAFAVIAVIIDHLTGWPGGGFVGVDIFFVISGFLITGLLLREHERTGHISFLGFYRRRVRRIMPAAVLTIVVTTTASFFAFAQVRFDEIKTDAFAALFFAANWRFASEKVDYFNADRAVSPLQHFWSLSIEEQFYFVWPWLMLAIFAVLLTRNSSRRTAHLAVGATMAAITLASFGWAVYQTTTDAHTAYFSTLTRVWELGFGAFLAVAATQLGRIPAAIRPALAWIGLAGMVASLWVIDGDQNFPAPAAALPVLATGFVIAAGTRADRGQQRFLWPLTNAGSQYIGDVSYSLYLWHFPIIIIGASLIGSSATDKAVLAVAIAVVSLYAYHLVEDPIRCGALFGPGSRPRSWFSDVSEGYKYVALSGLGVLCVTLTVVALQPTSPPKTFQVALPAGNAAEQPSGGKGGPTGSAQAALSSEIVTALGASEWPTLAPPMDEAIGSRQAPEDVFDCGVADHPDPIGCSWGSAGATHTAVVVGDSMSMTYVNPIRTILADNPDWKVVSLGEFGCVFADSDIYMGDTPQQKSCQQHKAEALTNIRELHPDIVFISNLAVQLTERGESSPMSSSDLGASITRMAQKVAPNAGKVVFLAGPPVGVDIGECYTPRSTPGDCVTKVDGRWSDRAANDQAAAQAVNGVWVDSRPWFCVQGLCPAFVGSTPVKLDVSHMTIDYGEKIAPAIEEALVKAKVLPAARD